MLHSNYQNEKSKAPMILKFIIIKEDQNLLPLDELEPLSLDRISSLILSLEKRSSVLPISYSLVGNLSLIRSILMDISLNTLYSLSGSLFNLKLESPTPNFDFWLPISPDEEDEDYDEADLFC